MINVSGCDNRAQHWVCLCCGGRQCSRIIGVHPREEDFPHRFHKLTKTISFVKLKRIFARVVMLLRFGYFWRDSENISISGGEYLKVGLKSQPGWERESVGRPNYESFTNDQNKSKLIILSHFRAPNHMSFYFKWWSHLIIVSVDVDESKVKASVPRVIIVAVVLGIILVVIVKVFTVLLIYWQWLWSLSFVNVIFGIIVNVNYDCKIHEDLMNHWFGWKPRLVDKMWTCAFIFTF